MQPSPRSKEASSILVGAKPGDRVSRDRRAGLEAFVPSVVPSLAVFSMAEEPATPLLSSRPLQCLRKSGLGKCLCGEVNCLKTIPGWKEQEHLQHTPGVSSWGGGVQVEVHAGEKYSGLLFVALCMQGFRWYLA